MNLSRLFQPKNPLFWLVLVINALSLVLGWIAQTWVLNRTGLLLVGGFGISNALLGIWLAWRLVKDDPR